MSEKIKPKPAVPIAKNKKSAASFKGNINASVEHAKSGRNRDLNKSTRTNGKIYKKSSVKPPDDKPTGRSK